MKKLFVISLFIFCARLSFATAYTVTCTHRTMHAGDLVPPVMPDITTGSTHVGAPSAIYSSPPSCTTSVTSASAVGTYTITAIAGTLAVGGDTQSLVNGTISVIAPDGIGASLKNNITYPSGFMSSSLPYGAIDVTNNPWCNEVGDGVTDNTDCNQYLNVVTRGTASFKATCTGTPSVTGISGTSFTGVSAGSIVNILGIAYTISSITDATHMVLTSNCPSQSNVQANLPRFIVNVSGTTVTWVSGPQFSSLTVNRLMQIGTSTSSNGFFHISSITDATHLVLTTAPSTATNIAMYDATLFNANSTGFMPSFLYYPAGKYAVSDIQYPYGAYWTWFGVGAQQSIIYLLPNSAHYQGSAFNFIDATPINKNNSYHEFIRNMGVEVGVGNPGAIAVSYNPSNDGALRNMQIWCDDSLCVTPLTISHSEVGPGYSKHVALYGGTNSLVTSFTSYNFTMENFTLEGSTGTAWPNTQISVQGRLFLFDTGSSAAMTNNLAGTNMVLMNSEIFANGASQCIQNSQSSGGQASAIYLKAIQVSGCTASYNDYATGTLVTSSGNVTEYATGTWQSLFDSASTPQSLSLPITETPTPSDPAVSGWIQLSNNPATWTAALASCTSTTAYLPPARYPGTGGPTAYSVNVPDCINHIQTYDAMPTEGSTYVVTFNLSGSSSTPLIFDNCFNNQCAFNNTGTRPLALVDVNSYNYTGSSTANLWGEDVILGANLNTNNTVTFNPGQNVWMRQLDLEPAVANKLTCNGSNFWTFGYKTEHNGSLIIENSGCMAEVYGFSALGDPAVQGGGGIVFQINDSSLFATGRALTQCTIPIPPSTVGCNNQFYQWVQESRSGSTLSLPVPLAQTVGSTQNLTGPYYAFGSSAPPATNYLIFQGIIKATGKVIYQ